MNLFKRSWKSVIRVKGRSSLYCFLFFIISFFVLLGIGMQEASKNAILLAKEKMSPIVLINSNNDAIRSNIDLYNQTSESETDEMLEILHDEDIVVWNRLVRGVARSISFDSTSIMPEGQGILNYMNISLIGNEISDMIEFHNNTYSMIEGRFYNQEEINTNAHVVVIEKGLADTNQLKIGDELEIRFCTLDDESNIYLATEMQMTSLQIIGIYKNNTDENPTLGGNVRMVEDLELLENKLLVPSTTLTEFFVARANASGRYMDEKDGYDNITIYKENMYYENPILLLKSPDLLSDFIERNEQQVAPYYLLDSNNQTYENYGKPLRVISFFAQIILVLVLINAILILTTVTTLFVKNRQVEIGSYLSLGMKKGSIILQFFLELMLEMGIGFCLALLLSNSVLNQLSDQILSLSIIEEQTGQNNGYEFSNMDQFKYFTEISQQDILEKFQIKLNSTVILGCLLCQFTVLIISISIASLSIMRFSPKRILMTIQ